MVRLIFSLRGQRTIRVNAISIQRKLFRLITTSCRAEKGIICQGYLYAPPQTIRLIVPGASWQYHPILG